MKIISKKNVFLDLLSIQEFDPKTGTIFAGEKARLKQQAVSPTWIS
jgi:hypothetical protein